MLSLPHGVFVAIIVTSSVLAFTSCPIGYVNAFGDKCYRMTHDMEDWDHAHTLCQDYGDDLVSIHSYAENVAIQAYLPGCCAYWIGLRCVSGELFWSDGTPLDYNNTGDGAACNPSLAAYFRQTDGSWILEPKTASIYVICEYKGAYTTTNTTTTTTTGPTTHRISSTTTSGPLLGDISTTTTSGPFPGGISTSTTSGPLLGGGSECGLGYQLLNDNSGICVRISDELTTWREAEAECQLKGAHLASIHNKQANDNIRRLALLQRLVNAIFVGIKINTQTNAVSWSDGSDFDFTNFDPGMPNTFFGECGAMQTGNLGGEWTSVFCDESNKLPFACSKPQPCPATNTFTGSGDFTSPEYPSSRSSGLSCEYFIGASPGSLVLLRFDEFQLVDGDQLVLYEGMGTGEPLAVYVSSRP